MTYDRKKKRRNDITGQGRGDERVSLRSEWTKESRLLKGRRVRRVPKGRQGNGEGRTEHETVPLRTEFLSRHTETGGHVSVVFPLPTETSPFLLRPPPHNLRAYTSYRIVQSRTWLDRQPVLVVDGQLLSKLGDPLGSRL